MSTQSLNYVCEMFEWISHTSSRTAKTEGLKKLKACGGEIDSIAQTLLATALGWYNTFGVGTLDDDERLVKERPSASFESYITLIGQLESGQRRDDDYIQGILGGFNPITYRWLRKCLLKDAKMGVNHTTVNKVWPGLIKTFSCQLADVLEDPEKLIFPVAVEVKIDGVRCVARVEGEMIRFCSRSGQPLYNLEDVKKHLLFSLYDKGYDLDKGLVLDGELFVNDLPSTLGTVRRSVSQPDSDLLKGLKFYVFDAMPLSEWDDKKCPTPYKHRNDYLNRFLPLMGQDRNAKAEKVISYIANNVDDLNTIFDYAISSGSEGIMCKSLSGLYTFNRSSSWLKYKPWDVDEFKITGCYEGSGRLAGNLGGVYVESDKVLETAVGGGYSDALRTKLWSEQKTLIGKKIRVKYKVITEDKRLREPVFVSFV